MLTPGEILKKRRLSIGKTLSEVSQDTRILEKYLKQIESDQYDQFDSPVFVRGFIKIYAQYLGLDDEKVLALFRRESKNSQSKISIGNKKKLDFKNTDINKVLLYTISAFVGIFFVIYSAIQIRLYQETPKLQIITPISGYESKEKNIAIEGITSSTAEIYINNSMIDSTKGVFKTNQELAEGENTLTVKAVNSRNKDKVTEQILKLYYTVQDQVKEDPVKQESSLNLTLKIKNEASWIKLIIDDKQKLAQTVNPGYNQKFKVEKTFEVVSGRIENTQVFINDKLWPLKINTETGIASLSCKLENNTVVCPQ